MLRKISLCVVAAAGTAAAATAVQAESYTTRIEPRPFYGAVVTLEEGVRVIRPLPPERQVIINPSNAPVSLGFNETRVYEKRDVYNHNSGAAYGSGGPAIYGTPSFGPGYRDGRGGHDGGPGKGGHHGGRGGVSGY